MNLAVLFADYASSLHRKDSYFLLKVGSDPQFYSGKGNLCQQVGMEFEALGYNRIQRLELLGTVFGYSRLNSMKEMTVGQMRTVLILHQFLKELADGFRQIH